MPNNPKLNFIKEDKLSASFTSLLDEEFNRKSAPQLRTIFSPSSMTECDRRLIYRVTGLKPEFDPLSFKDESNQISIKNKWLHYFSEFRGIKILEENYQVGDCVFNLAGMIDVVLGFSNLVIATGIKGLNDVDFSKIKKKGAFRRHVVEMVINLWMSEIDDGLLIYENKSNQDYIVFHVTGYTPIVESIKAKCEELVECKIKGLIPKRCYEDDTSNECKKCEFKVQCWK